MSDWTRSASECLDQWLDRMVSVVPADTDRAEVREDLRAHVLLDVENAQLSLVTEDDVRRITAKLGSPPRDVAEAAAPEAERRPGGPPLSLAKAGPPPRRLTAFVTLAGIVLPVAALLVESASHTWGHMLFNPIPTLFHVLVIAIVPAANFLCLWLADETLARHPRLFGTLNGFAIGVSIIYTLFLLPGLPLALFGLVVLLGILPLSPIFAFFACLSARRWISQGGRIPRVARLPTALVGILLAVGVLLVFEVRGFVTASLLEQAASGDPDSRLSAVRNLRRFGDEQAMLSAARGDTRVPNRGSLLPFGILLQKRCTAEAVSEVWYRMTGQTVASPWSASPGGEEDFFFSGGDGEPVRPSVQLTVSRLDGVVDGPGCNVYLEWTLEFRSLGFGQQEAVVDILLPPGGVVSRATLWVKGEEREAAFAGRRQAQEAYERVVSYRRDPLLVTSSGNERVLVRGFPVMPNEDFRCRIGMTAPLVLDSPSRGTIVLPRLARRSFDLLPDLRHSVWIESSVPLRDAPAFTLEQRSEHGYTARGQLSDAQIGLGSATIVVERTPADLTVSKDLLTPTDQRVVIQKIVNSTPQRPSRIVLVVDGGAPMKDHLRGVADAIANIPDGLELGVIYGGDTIADLGGGCRTTTRAVVQDLAAKLSEQTAIGGTDGVAALSKGFELAAESPHAAVVWFHAEVGRTLRPGAGLVQAIERRPDDPKLYDFALSPGVDEVGRLIPPQRVQRVHRLGDVASDFTRLVGWWTGARHKFTYERDRIAASSVPAGAVEATAHVGRLWANDFINRISFPSRPQGLEEAIKLARTFQIVTPVSGAVVLETVEQFQGAGLQPIDPRSAPEVPVPSVPEPHEWALLAVAALALGWMFLRRRTTPRFA